MKTDSNHGKMEIKEVVTSQKTDQQKKTKGIQEVETEFISNDGK
jgi:hypothetical protein